MGKTFSSPIITLTTDWGLKDYYTGAVKGVILQQLPGARIVDITHSIQPFDILQASFVLRNCYRSFPNGTVHVIGVNSDASPETPHTAVFIENQYFISADNGLFSLVFDTEPDKVVEIDITQDSDSFAFVGRDIFIKAACHLAAGKPIEELGAVKQSLVQKMSFKPVVNGNMIRGKVIYIDAYENVFVNITQSLFREVVRSKQFRILLRHTGYGITRICESYSDVPEGEMLALFNSNGYLEIAMNRANAASLLGLGVDDVVIIEYS